MATLSNLVDNFTEGIHKIKCEDSDCFLIYVLRRILEDINIYLVIKIIQTKLMKYWKRDFKNTFTFSNNNINTFILSLWKGVYPYENIDNWEKFNETTIPEKEEFYSNLKMEDITDAD